MLFRARATQFADEKGNKRKMAAELERLMNVDTVQFGELTPRAARSVSKRMAHAVRPESRIQTLSLVLENLWLFYEAMHSGRPLARGDERLTQMRVALMSSIGKQR
jgi:hypothetical protein